MLLRAYGICYREGKWRIIMAQILEFPKEETIDPTEEEICRWFNDVINMLEKQEPLTLGELFNLYFN